MFKWTAFPFIRIALCLIMGIVLHEHYVELWMGWQWVLPVFLLVYLVGHAFSKPFISGLLSLSLLVYLGGLMADFADHTSEPHHYHNQGRVDGFIGAIDSDNTERDRYHRFEMSLKAICKGDTVRAATGVIYFYIKKDSMDHKLPQYGDIVMVNQGYFPVAAPKNPYEFNYQQYLERQGIYAHAFVEYDNIRVVDHRPNAHLLKWAYEIRSYVKTQIAKFIQAERERAILTALLVGIKDYLNEDTKMAYASAGAMHVLAVSGLHVGIVYVLLTWLFQRWKETRVGRVVFVFISVFIIWMYALVTGFSPSVLRAVTMFSVIIISSGFARRANIYNSLGLAACVLIALSPNIIYAVGFQLSFAAVLGIVLIQPRIYRWFEFNQKVPDYLWSITCVSIAAQIATFPLTMLYFHQFPTYFLVSNLIVIPAAVVMLVAGIAMSALGTLWEPIGEYIGVALENFVWLINELIEALQYLPKPIFDWLYFDVWDTFLVYAILLFGLLAFVKYNFQYLVTSFLAVIALIGWLHYKTHEHLHQQDFVFYEIDGVTAIDLISGTQASLLVDDYQQANEEVITFQVDPNRLALGLPKSSETWEFFSESPLVYHHNYFDLLYWNGKKVAIVRGGELWSDTIRADVIYFKEKEDFHQRFMAEQVILGTSFSYYEAQHIRETLDTDVHVLAQDGYWSYNQQISRELAINSESH